jgi:hypothetical protein
MTSASAAGLSLALTTTREEMRGRCHSRSIGPNGSPTAGHVSGSRSRLQPDVLNSADPDDASAQIDLMGVPWLMISEEPSAAPNGGDVRVERLTSQLQNASVMASWSA